MQLTESGMVEDGKRLIVSFFFNVCAVLDSSVCTQRATCSVCVCVLCCKAFVQLLLFNQLLQPVTKQLIQILCFSLSCS